MNLDVLKKMPDNNFFPYWTVLDTGLLRMSSGYNSENLLIPELARQYPKAPDSVDSFYIIQYI